MEDAQLCAAREEVFCANQNDDWGTPPDNKPPSPPGVPPDNKPPIPPGGNPPNNPKQVYTNVPQLCEFTCPDGLPFSYVVAGGLFAAASQAQADNMAHSYACTKAAQLHICLSNMPPYGCCIGFNCNRTITANKPVSFSITSGSLPPGLNLTQVGIATALISGMAMASGTYTFTVTATDSQGNFISKPYTIGVFDLTNADLMPDATIGQYYSYQLLGTGGASPYTFAFVAGAFPDGLSMNASGSITGTCGGAAGTFTAAITITDSNGLSCEDSITITVLNGACFTDPAILPNGITCGAAYSYFMTVDPSVTPDPGFTFCYQVTAGALPDGLSLDYNTGEIAGFPTTPGTYNFTICLCQT